MIECDGLPLLEAVTGLTFRAVAAVMDILYFMAIDASVRQVFVALADVTDGALNLGMCAVERKFGLAVIEGFGFRPCRFIVTCRAFLAEPAFMGIVFFMTIETPRRGFAIHLPLGVATLAWRCRVCAFEFEVGWCVVERFLVELHDIGAAALVVGVA